MNTSTSITVPEGQKRLSNIEDALRKLDCKEYRDGKWQCPVCGKEKQLSITQAPDGTKVILHCFRGCETEGILEALGLKWSDLFLVSGLEDLEKDKLFQIALGKTLDLTKRQMGAYDNAVADEVFKLHIRDVARAEYYGRNNPYPDTCSTDDIEDTPDAEWLIDGVLERGVVAFVVGFTGTAKSFVMADWSMSVATGKSWLGHTTHQDPVLYIAAEGGRTHKKRVKAWKKHHGRSHTGHLAWKKKPVQIMNDLHFDALLREVKAGNYRLVVIDTLSRCFVGFNQKDELDIGKLYDRLQKLRDALEEYGTTVIVVHHTGWNDKGRSRGSSDLPSSADAEYVLTAEDILQGVQLECTKMKDEERNWKINLKLEKVELGQDSKGREVNSLVVTQGPDELIIAKSEDPRKIDQAWRRNFLSEFDFDRAYSTAELTKVLNEHMRKDRPASEWTVRQDLKALGLNPVKTGKTVMWTKEAG